VKIKFLAFLGGRPLDDKQVYWQWRDFWRLYGLYVSIQIVMSIFLSQILRRTFLLSFIDAGSIVYAVSLLMLIPFVRHYEFWPSLSYLGATLIDFQKFWKVGVVYGLVLRVAPLAPVLVVVLIMQLGGQMPYLPDNNPVMGHAVFSFSWFLGALRGVVFAPVVEEYFYRGLLYPLLRLRWGVRSAILFSSVLFGVMHGVNLLGFWAVFGGIGFAVAYEHTGKLATPIVAHFIVNAIATVLGSI